MSLSSPFIYRPVATTLLAVGLAISGIVAFYFLPASALPQIDFPTIIVQAALPGASPEIMASSVATPLERQLGQIAGVTEMTSSSTLGNTRVIIQFDLSRNIDGAARDVQAAINAARSHLPKDLPNQPTYRKVNPADAPILILALTSDVYNVGQMYDAASTILQQKISQIDGVGNVIVGGSALPGVRVELNPTALNQYGISLEKVRQIIAQSNVSTPKGSFSNDKWTSDITANDQIFRAYQYRPLIIDYQNGSPVRLSDVAEVVDSVEDLRNAGLSKGKPAVVLVIFKQPSVNVIKTVDNVKATIPQLKGAIPAEINMNVVMDRTTTIRASLKDVELTLVIAVVLIVLVIYAFLKEVRAAVIPSLTIPLCLLGTFSVMYLLGYTLDNLSLMALTIGTGFVVDDGVVVLENISRHIEAGETPFNAALRGAKEVGFTVLSMTTSLIAVFLPILLMQGIVGRLFREFAITLSVALVVSMVVSLTVTPMMCAYLLHKRTKKEKVAYSHSEVIETRGYYSKALYWALEHRRLMLSLTVLAIVLSVYLFKIIPKGFFPEQDTGRITGTIQAQQNISFQAMKEKLAEFVDIVKKDPAVEEVVGFLGGSGGPSGRTINSGSLYITLVPLEKRKISSDEVIARLRKELSEVPASNLYLVSAQDLVVGGRQSNAQYLYTMTAYDLETLNHWVPQVMEEMAKIPGVVDLNSDQLNLGLQEFVNIDRESASRFGITAEVIDNVLYDAFGQRQVSILYTPMNQYHVVMEVAPEYWQDPKTLNDIYVPSASGPLVPLSVFANFDTASTLLQVNHQGQYPAVTLSFNLLPNVSLGTVVKAMTQAIKTLHLPESTVIGSFQGTAEAFQSSLKSQKYLIIAALIAVYIVLGILYENLIHPITILSTLPSAGVGALLALLITRTDLSIIALIGIILLIGIVKKNAIMMIDFALVLEREHGKTPKEAIHEACILRFRPIMMTTIAAMLSAVPLAAGYGVGAELRQPLGITIIGGLLLSQMMTLFTTPVIYLTFESWAKRWRERWMMHFTKGVSHS